jgi:hypothetical protein
MNCSDNFRRQAFQAKNGQNGHNEAVLAASVVGETPKRRSKL